MGCSLYRHIYVPRKALDCPYKILALADSFLYLFADCFRFCVFVEGCFLIVSLLLHCASRTREEPNDIIFFKEGMIMKFLLENISLFIDLIYYFLLSALVIVIGGVFIVAALDFNGSFMYIKPIN